MGQGDYSDHGGTTLAQSVGCTGVGACLGGPGHPVSDPEPRSEMLLPALFLIFLFWSPARLSTTSLTLAFLQNSTSLLGERE